MPDEAEAHALLALMLINHGRTTARFQAGELVLLDDQDRSLWDLHLIDEGRHMLERTLALRGSGPYTIQAAIADLHLQQPRDWEELELLYQRLEHITGSPVVTMNRAIALAELEGPQAALALLDRLELDDARYYHSTRADLLRRLGRDDEARAPHPDHRARADDPDRARRRTRGRPHHNGRAARPPATSEHNRRFGLVVLPGVAVAAACSIGLLVDRPSTVQLWAPVAVGALLVVVIASTAARKLEAPQHARLAMGWNESSHRLLVGSNWIRVAAWSAAGAISLWMCSATVITT
jgi:hypothetical protein